MPLYKSFVGSCIISYNTNIVKSERWDQAKWYKCVNKEKLPPLPMHGHFKILQTKPKYVGFTEFVSYGT